MDERRVLRSWDVGGWGMSREGGKQASGKQTHRRSIQWLDTWECLGEDEELDDEEDDAAE